MKAKTLAALQASIAHWELLAVGGQDEIGPHSCALCQKFLNPKSNQTKHCGGCPVEQRTMEKYCRETPFDEVIEIDELFPRSSIQFKTAALAELNFLKSLLPT